MRTGRNEGRAAVVRRAALCAAAIAAGLATSTMPAAAATGDISTVAGGLGDGGAGPGGDIRRPEGVAVDSAGNVYVADTEHNRIRKIDTLGVITTVAGTWEYGYAGDGGPATSAKLWSPYGVAVDAAGNLFIADTGNNRIRKVSTSGMITTVAGNGTPGFSGDGGSAISAQFHYPDALTVDAGGNVYIADTDNHRIRKVNTSGTITTVAGNGTPGFSGDGGAATSAQIKKPQGVAVDGSGNLYITDTDNHRIRKVSTGGTVTTVAGTTTYGFSGDGGPATSAKLFYPREVVVDGTGNLFIVDGSNDRIRRVSTSGTITTVAGGGGTGFSGDGGPATSAALDLPHGLAVGSGNIYIADTYNHRIRKVNASGTITTIGGSGFACATGDGGSAAAARLCDPEGIAADSAGNVYVTDTGSHSIRRISAAGVISTVAGNGTSGFSGDGGAATAANLSSPRGVAADSGGNLYIADTGNHRIRKVNASGTITTVAGTGGAGSLGDGGAATNAQLSSPRGVAVDSGGNLYIVDTGNHRIRKVNASGTITTAVGTGSAGFSGDGGPAVLAQLSSPGGVAVDVSGNVLVADTTNRRVRRVNVASGSITTVAGSGASGFSGDGGPATAAALYPAAVTADPGGSLFIADLSNQRIRKVNASGTITTIAGNGTNGYGGDGGPATSAKLSYPSGVAVDPNGHLHIIDSGNARVRKVEGVPASPITGTPATVTVSPSTQGRTVGDTATLTAHVADASNNSLSGVTVTFTRTGANPGSASSVTDINGDAVHTYTGSDAGTDTVEATVSGSSASGQATVVWSTATGNLPPVAPVLVAPADGGGVNGGPGQLFTVRATDPNGEPYTATVTIRQGTVVVRTFTTSLAPSGGESTGTPNPALVAGSYTWSARATDALGTTGPESASRSFTVSAPGNGGGGTVEGTATFDAPGIPTATSSCTPTSFTLEASSAAVVVNLAGAEYAGAISMNGYGSSSCENASAGEGDLTITDIAGTNALGGWITCATLTGSFVRFGADVKAVVTGSCSVNGQFTGSVSFQAQVEFAPTNPGGGISVPVTEAAFVGDFTVTPS